MSGPCRMLAFLTTVWRSEVHAPYEAFIHTRGGHLGSGTTTLDISTPPGTRPAADYGLWAKCLFTCTRCGLVSTKVVLVTLPSAGTEDCLGG